LNFLESWKNGWLDTEVQGLLVLETISQDVSYFFINRDELGRFFWQFFLYLIGVDEQVFKERP
jgi:hypothetical protein